MTTILPIGAQRPVASRETRRNETVEAEQAKAAVTALVPVAAAQPPAEDHRKGARRSSASFLAQLIANEKQLPQTRERRRAEPQQAIAAYGAAAQLTRRR
jgi:hypothetical protein